MTQTAEAVILDRFRQKCRAAGGPRTGFVLRRGSALFIQKNHPDLDLESGIAALVTKGLLKANESGAFLYLTAEGVDQLDSP